MKMLVEQYQVGETLKTEERNPEQLADRITSLVNSVEKYEHYQRQSVLAGKELNWEKEKGKLVNYYKNKV